MLARRDAITNEVLEPITSVLANPTALPQTLRLCVFIPWLLHSEYESATFFLHVLLFYRATRRNNGEGCNLQSSCSL